MPPASPGDHTDGNHLKDLPVLKLEQFEQQNK